MWDLGSDTFSENARSENEKLVHEGVSLTDDAQVVNTLCKTACANRHFLLGALRLHIGGVCGGADVAARCRSQAWRLSRMWAKRRYSWRSGYSVGRARWSVPGSRGSRIGRGFGRVEPVTL